MILIQEFVSGVVTDLNSRWKITMNCIIILLRIICECQRWCRIADFVVLI